MTTAITFDDVVSAWHERVHCEQNTRDGFQCRRTASWLVNFHGCERVLLCGQHMRAWKRLVLFDFRRGPCRCCRCRRLFDRFDDACGIVAI